MCCLFTWMAWCFDASHRLVVFIMACLISSSVCCLLLTASLAGVAMGYNYSLAEYIDLKETNISVYIKRGVYDDEISDDFDWRRSDGGDANIQLRDQPGLRMGAPGGQQPLAAGGRRSDNSLFESDDQNKYEGGLMRLTSTEAGQAIRRFEPPAPPYTASAKTTPDLVDGLLRVADNLPGGSLERLKAIQAAARHHEARKIELATAKIPDNPSGRLNAIEENAQIHDARRSDQTTTTDKYDKYFKQLAYHPGFPGSGLNARKFMENNEKDISETKPPNRFRDAVFRGELPGWPVSVASKPATENFFEYEVSYIPSMPTPPTVKPLLVRPVEGAKPIINWDLKKLPESPSRRTSDSPRQKIADMPKAGAVFSDYDESHGLPMRKKRSDGQVSERRESFGVTPSSSTKIRNSQNYLRTETLNSELDISVNTGGSLTSDIKPSTKKSLKIELSLPTRFDNLKSEYSPSTFKELLLTFDDNNSKVSDKQSKINELEDINSFGKTKKKNVHFKPRKRMDSTGYEYKMRGNKQSKSIWWGIFNGAQEQWNKIIMYLGKHIPQVPDNSQNSQASDKSDLNSNDNKQSTFINKLVIIPTKKPVNDNKCNSAGTNTKTNLETSTSKEVNSTFT